jgi:hypothetical protein
VLDGRLEHCDTLKTMHYLARVHHHQQRLDAAKALFRQTIQSQESRFGPEDNDLLDTTNMLAVVYDAQERYDAAESLLIPEFSVREKDPRFRPFRHPQHKTLPRHCLPLATTTTQLLPCSSKPCMLLRNILVCSTSTLSIMHYLVCSYASQGRHGDAD